MILRQTIMFPSSIIHLRHRNIFKHNGIENKLSLKHEQLPGIIIFCHNSFICRCYLFTCAVSDDDKKTPRMRRQAISVASSGLSATSTPRFTKKAGKYQISSNSQVTDSSSRDKGFQQEMLAIRFRTRLAKTREIKHHLGKTVGLIETC